MAENVCFDCSKKGIYVQCMDSGHIALVNLVISSSACSRYECKQGTSVEINLESLLKVLDLLPSADTVTVEKEELDGDKIDIILKNDDKCVSFNLNLLEIDADSLDIPACTYDVEVELPSTDFANSLKRLLAFTDNVALNIDSKNPKQMDMIISSDQGQGVIEVNNIPNMTVRKNFKGTFSLKYLARFTKGKDISDTTVLKLKKDNPLVMEYHLKDKQDKDQIILSFFLAPKIADDDY